MAKFFFKKNIKKNIKKNFWENSEAIVVVMNLYFDDLYVIYKFYRNPKFGF